MPAYPYLFDLRPADQVQPADRVVKVPDEWVEDGMVVVARPEALDLVAYLLAMDRTYPAVPSLPIPRQRTVEP
jgi:cytochrome c oxidase cbb3-type subunit 2